MVVWVLGSYCVFLYELHLNHEGTDPANTSSIKPNYCFQCKDLNKSVQLKYL